MLALSALVLLPVQRVPAQGEASVEYVSDVLGERLLFHSQGFGNLGVDACAWVEGRTKLPLRVRDREYAKGLGHHANGEIVLLLEGRYAIFEAEVGVQWEHGDTGSVVFQVLVDGEKRFDSGIVREADEPRPLSVPLSGAQILTLKASDAGDGITCDCANWLNARLTVDPSARPQARPSVDVAPFGTVCTWDPKRLDGTHAGRVDEFPAGDVYLHTPIRPQADGTYVMPLVDDVGCIGIQWVERRLLRSVGLEFVGPAPATEGVQLQYWAGESWWQGQWEPLPGKLTADGPRWSFAIDWRAAGGSLVPSTQKVRWLLPGAPATRVRLSAFTRSVWDEVTLALQAEHANRGEKGSVWVYNGERIGRRGRTSPLWSLARPMELRVCYSRPMSIKSDRTTLRFWLPRSDRRAATAFAVAVEDVLANGAVYVPSAGVFVTTASGPTPEEYEHRIAGQQTVLDEVHAHADQTFAQALAKVHRPVQDLGPMLLSLACDDRKFQADRDGTVQFSTQPDVASHGAIRYPIEVRPTFGSGKNEGLTRHLQGEWLPIPVIEVEEGGIRYRQRAFVAPYPARGPGASLCVADVTAENLGEAAAHASVGLRFMADRFAGEVAELKAVGAGFAAYKGERLLAYAETSEAALSATAGAGALDLAGGLPPRGRARVTVYMPTWEMRPEECSLLKDGPSLASAVEANWHHVLAESMQFDIPDPLLANVIRASQVHCLIAARNEADGERTAPWISSDRYGPLESEANSIILGMDLLGHEDFARKSLDFFVNRYNPQGYLTTGYTVMGTGWHLWTLAEHYRLTRDDAWLRRIAPEVARVCQWTVEQRRKTMTSRDEPEYGLMPPGVVADWGMYANRFFGEAHMCAGLRDAASVLAEIDYPGAEEWLTEAEDYRQDILRAYRWAQARTPVRPLRDGSWTPACPAMVQCFGKVGESFPGEDWGRTWAGDVEIGPQHLVALGLMPPDAPDAQWMMDYLEDYWCLQTGMGEYPGEQSEADPFDLGGFSKVQPYYTRMTDVYALQDEVKPFIRSYLNAIPSLLSLENLSFWEHFHNTGGWNKTHETGWFLQQTRTMLLMERGEELWLAPFVPDYWLKDGLIVGVSHAPTHFGEVGYSIRSHVGEGFIEARVDPPKRAQPKAIVLRVRHPEGRPMRSVTVDGKPHADFDAKRECVRLSPTTDAITVRVTY
ncbi:MAG: hypothetical protein FJX75_13415 [Armatimonadetes bacterium]|nr:hypothetical protein [Armatimonadota bacterium]